MAVDPVTGVSPTTTTNPPSGNGGGAIDYTKMTPQEILEAEKNGETIPPEILKWAKENPDSKITYAGSQGGDGNNATEENDAVAYSEFLDSAGVSLKEQCKMFTMISESMERRDLQNVVQMAPYTQQVPDDEQTGNNATSEVEKVLGDINKEVKQSFKSLIGGRSFFDGMRFFSALKAGASGELTTINESLSQIQDILDGSIADAKESKQYGEETGRLGKELKSNSKWWRFGRKHVASRAIEQGDLTVKMSERTNKLAEAIAKDNGIALKQTGDNINTVNGAEIPPEDNSGTNPSNSDGGNPPPQNQ